MGIEVSEQSWFSRIGGAFTGMIIGGLLCLVGPVLLFWNEGRAVKTAKGLKEGASVVQSIEIDRVDPANNGVFVHVTGMATTNEQLRDDQFGVESNAIRLVRHVEMFQWKENTSTRTEKKLGGGKKKITEYSYEKVWHPGRIDSSHFNESANHQNPQQLPFDSSTQQAAQVALGAFKLPKTLISRISGRDPLEIANPTPPKQFESQTRIGSHQNATMFYISRAVNPSQSQNSETTPVPNGLIDLNRVGTEEASDAKPFSDASSATHPQESRSTPSETAASLPTEIPAEPQLGDTRIWFTVTPASTISILSQQSGESFAPYVTQTGTELHRLEMGSATAQEMIQHAETENTILTWAIRVGGTAALFFGFLMLMRPMVVLADVVPIFGTILGMGTGVIAALLAFMIAFTVIGFAWLFYRPLLGGSLLAIAGVCLFLIFRRGKKSRGNDRESPETLTELDLV